MSKYDLILNEIAPKFGDQLKPLICIVVPRISENCLLITVSERFSERYVSRIISLDRFLVSANRDLLVAEIQAAFNLRDASLLGSFK